ncbi:MAG: hypothetical protein QHH09_00125 [Microgenomates group bacterium]|jgi:hypothetical protein|nr:hypothetical protein [Microgenomates group bacterium]
MAAVGLAYLTREFAPVCYSAPLVFTGPVATGIWAQNKIRMIKNEAQNRLTKLVQEFALGDFITNPNISFCLFDPVVRPYSDSLKLRGELYRRLADLDLTREENFNLILMILTSLLAFENPLTTTNDGNLLELGLTGMHNLLGKLSQNHSLRPVILATFSGLVAKETTRTIAKDFIKRYMDQGESEIALTPPDLITNLWPNNLSQASNLQVVQDWVIACTRPSLS